ncbi:SDR family NAD(P)-dependent oxidoreductase [Thalassotalea sp. PLHSN55]|uniref:SDR family NAD(P)-dependent oxidoreductase n=1 Tax=Thalassotalea sp. PLHSN55 TaxID=3435888 RepID=UPI003F840EAD
MHSSTQYSDLKDKVVFITGGASGIGAAMVELFLQQQAKVAFIDIDETASNKLLAQSHINVWYRKVDVTDINALQQSIVDAAAELGSLDILINNVADDMRYRPEDISVDTWRQNMKVNLDPAFFASQTAHQLMKGNDTGSIINFSSLSVLFGLEKLAPYITAKAGLIGMTKALAHDFGDDNIRVNAIVPGWIATDRQLETWLTAKEEKQWTQTMAIKKRIQPSDVAKLALFLASSDSAMITGQSIAIDGGKT